MFDETFKGVCNWLHQPIGWIITVNNLLMGVEMPGTSSLSSVPWADACPFISNAPAVGCRRECRAANNKNNPIWGSGTCSLYSKDTMSSDVPRNWTIIEYLTNTHQQELFSHGLCLWNSISDIFTCRVSVSTQRRKLKVQNPKGAAVFLETGTHRHEWNCNLRGTARDKPQTMRPSHWS